MAMEKAIFPGDGGYDVCSVRLNVSCLVSSLFLQKQTDCER